MPYGADIQKLPIMAFVATVRPAIRTILIQFAHLTTTHTKTLVRLYAPENPLPIREFVIPSATATKG